MWTIFATMNSWLTNIAKGLKYWGESLYALIWKLFSSIWGLLIIIGFLSWVALKDIALTMGSLITMLSNVDPGTHDLSAPTGALYWLSVANTFGPMDELFGYMFLYVHLQVAFGIYKLLKSWMPEFFGNSFGSGSGS